MIRVKAGFSVLFLSLFVLLFLSCTSWIFVGKCQPVEYGLGVYWDRECMDRVRYMEWVCILRGRDRDFTIYIRNEGTRNITQMDLAAGNWVPALAAQYINLTWDYVVHTLEPSQVENVTLTLSVREDIPVSSFTFDFTISCTWALEIAPSALVTNVTIPSVGTIANPIPEFSSLLFLPLFMAATLLAVIIYRRKKIVR